MIDRNESVCVMYLNICILSLGRGMSRTSKGMILCKVSLLELMKPLDHIGHFGVPRLYPSGAGAQ